MKRFIGLILAALGLLVLLSDHLLGTNLVATAGSTAFMAGTFFGWLITCGTLIGTGFYQLFKAD